MRNHIAESDPLTDTNARPRGAQAIFDEIDEFAGRGQLILRSIDTRIAELERERQDLIDARAKAVSLMTQLAGIRDVLP